MRWPNDGNRRGRRADARSCLPSSTRRCYAALLQKLGRSRRTQDSPVVPDVWLRYIRVAEEIAHARMAGRPSPAMLPSTCC